MEDNSSGGNFTAKYGIKAIPNSSAYRDCSPSRFCSSLGNVASGGLIIMFLGFLCADSAWAATPGVTYGTYFGGSGTDSATAIASDAQGDIFIAGVTTSTDLPGTAGSYQPNKAVGFPGTTDLFIAKFDPTGRTLLWTTYLGGDGNDSLIGMMTDPQGNVYVTGNTASSNFPFTSHLPGSSSSGNVPFVAKLSSDGKQLIYSDTLPLQPVCITVDSTGDAYLVGGNYSFQFPTAPALSSPGFALLKLNAAGSAVVFGALLGSGTPTTIAVDTLGNAYIGGNTLGGVLTTPSTYQPNFSNDGLQQSGQPISNGFIIEVNNTGTQLVYGTYFGPRYANTTINHISPGPDGAIYFSGTINGSTITATSGVYQNAPGPSFIARLNPAWTALDAFSYLPYPPAEPATFAVGRDNTVHCYVVVGAPEYRDYVALSGPTLSLIAQTQTIAAWQLILSPSNDIWMVGNGPSALTTKFVAADAFQPTAKSSSTGFFIKIGSSGAAQSGLGSLSIVSGNNQTGSVGTPLGQNLVVKVLGTDGSPYAGATVTFAVTTGSAIVSPASLASGADGTAATSVTLGNTAGPIQITASITGLPSVTSSATAVAAGSSLLAPQIDNGGIMSAGLSSPLIQTASPNATLSIFGQNFAPLGTNRKVLPPDFANGLMPTNLEGVCVLFGSQRAPVFLVTPGQLNVQVPQVPFPSSVTVQVTTGCDTSTPLSSNQITVPTQAAAPEFFYAAQDGSGTSPVSAIDGFTNAQIGDPARLGPSYTLAYPGEVVTIYATGFGLTTPAFAPGELATTGAQIAGMTVMIDGIAVDPSTVQYAGVVIGAAGLYQLNVVLPTGLAPGDHTIVVSINGASSPSSAYISVGPPPSS